MSAHSLINKIHKLRKWTAKRDKEKSKPARKRCFQIQTPIPQKPHVMAWVIATLGLALVGVVAAFILARRRRRLGALD